MAGQGCAGRHQVSFAALHPSILQKLTLSRSFDVKRDVQDEWNVYGDEILKRTVWNSGCSSWYKNEKGRISALYPGSIIHFVSSRLQLLSIVTR